MATDWWRSLQVGDEVGVDTRSVYQPPKIYKIQRVTPSGQIVLENGQRFNNPKWGTPVEIGSGTTRYKDKLVTAAYARLQIQRHEDARRVHDKVSILNSVSWSRYDEELLDSVIELVRVAQRHKKVDELTK